MPPSGKQSSSLLESIFVDILSRTSFSSEQMVNIFYFWSKSVGISSFFLLQWLSFRQTLPLFTSLINIVFTYNPVGYLPYNYLLFTDTREPLVEVAAQVLCIALDNSSLSIMDVATSPTSKTLPSSSGDECPNLFINYLSRIHRDDVRLRSNWFFIDRWTFDALGFQYFIERFFPFIEQSFDSNIFTGFGEKDRLLSRIINFILEILWSK